MLEVFDDGRLRFTGEEDFQPIEFRILTHGYLFNVHLAAISSILVDLPQVIFGVRNDLGSTVDKFDIPMTMDHALAFDLSLEGRAFGHEIKTMSHTVIFLPPFPFDLFQGRDSLDNVSKDCFKSLPFRDDRQQEGFNLPVWTVVIGHYVGVVIADG